MTEVRELIERLEKRALEDERCADNSQIVADLLRPQMDLFERRSKFGWNTYAVRMAVEHRNSVKRDSQYATDLRAAIALLRSKSEGHDNG